MSVMRVALLHPGEMGAGVGACLVARGVGVVWASAARSGASRKRAFEAGFEDLGTLDQVLEAADVVLSICPPSGALRLAQEVARTGFEGIYVDANAISPAHSREIGELVERGGASFVDGGILGLPPMATRKTRLYLCGARAADVAGLFAGSQTGAILMDGAVGAASALKMCFAAWSKGETALLGIVRSLARFEGVDGELLKEWDDTMPGVSKKSEQIVDRAFKAWRWAGEMEEIAQSFDAAGLPSGFLGIAEIYRRLEGYKDCAARPSSEEVSVKLRGGDSR